MDITNSFINLLNEYNHISIINIIVIDCQKALHIVPQSEEYSSYASTQKHLKAE